MEDEEEDEAPQVLDEEARQAIRVAESVMRTYSMEQALEAEFDPSLSERLAARMSGRMGAEGTIDAVLAQTLTAISEGEGTEVALSDWQGPTGYSKYDDEEAYAVSPADKQAAVQYKLTRQELANLVPQVRAGGRAAAAARARLAAWLRSLLTRTHARTAGRQQCTAEGQCQQLALSCRSPRALTPPPNPRRSGARPTWTGSPPARRRRSRCPSTASPSCGRRRTSRWRSTRCTAG